MDDKTKPAGLVLQLEELAELERTNKGKQREGEASDSETALGRYRESPETTLASLDDRNMRKSIAKAVASDASMIQQCSRQEDQAAWDRSMALSLDGDGDGASQNPLSTSNEAEEPIDNDMMKSVTRHNVPNTQGESSAWAASRDPGRGPEGERIETVACTSCLDQRPRSGMATAPCSHEYCGDCINQLFLGAIGDESLFPPRCCYQVIPLDDVVDLLATSTVGEFRAKELEFTTENRIYCHDSRCSTFVPPAFIKDKVATCVMCGAKTCALCKGATHDAADCPEDGPLKEVLRLAQDSGWQRCPSCKQLVQLREGCFHMTCLCRAEFCYLCGKEWKTCGCRCFDWDRLMPRPEIHVVRNRGNGQMPAERLAPLVEDEAAGIQGTRQRDGGRLGFLPGDRRCDVCGVWLPNASTNATSGARVYELWHQSICRPTRLWGRVRGFIS